MRHILPLLPKPSHYAGSEPGAVRKDPARVRCRMALAFPDLYTVGASYLGQAILYTAVNEREDLWAERVYAPSPEAAEVLRGRGAPLAALESHTPLAELDLIGFSLTHELCYTNVLYMLELAGLPLRAADRDASHPLVVAGGGCCYNAEPLAPFLDAMVLGDGERAVVDLMEAVAEAREAGLSRPALLERLATLPGFYVPSLTGAGAGQPVIRRAEPDLNALPAALAAPQSFDAVHNRLTLEIARGCTRGCRFCQAGMVYRPVRERSLSTLAAMVDQGLSATGHGEMSFLSLSTGDFSTLAGLFDQTVPRCKAEQVSLSLPSLRVGSVTGGVMQAVAGIRRTGVTIAPEAGSQRLRDVINKGVTEDGLMEHLDTLFGHGWRQVKLYFMIGLPTERREDLDAILDLCLKALERGRRALGKGGRLQVTASVSPFVPKPHTPFQWERQISLEECREKLAHLRDIFRPHKKLRLKHHMPEMSWLEGVFARGGRELAPAVEAAFRKGALFASWTDRLDLAPWREAFAESGLDPEAYLAARDPQGPLPWDHLSCGVTRDFLLAERGRALAAEATEDCRYGRCRGCGVCSEATGLANVLNARRRDQELSEPQTPDMPDSAPATPPGPPNDIAARGLTERAAQYRVRHVKTGPMAFLSQLELQDVLERALRRARLPLAFSAGFHPLPRLSFGRALPVGVQSLDEHFSIDLREDLAPETVFKALAKAMPPGLDILEVAKGPVRKKKPQSAFEDYRLTLPAERRQAWRDFAAAERQDWTRTTKRGEKTVDIRPLFAAIEEDAEGFMLRLDWRDAYVSPLGLARAVMPDVPLDSFTLTKTAQVFDEAESA